VPSLRTGRRPGAASANCLSRRRLAGQRVRAWLPFHRERKRPHGECDCLDAVADGRIGRGARPRPRAAARWVWGCNPIPSRQCARASAVPPCARARRPVDWASRISVEINRAAAIPRWLSWRLPPHRKPAPDGSARAHSGVQFERLAQLTSASSSLAQFGQRATQLARAAANSGFNSAAFSKLAHGFLDAPVRPAARRDR